MRRQQQQQQQQDEVKAFHYYLGLSKKHRRARYVAPLCIILNPII